MKRTTPALRSRLQRLLPNNYPRYVRCYDAGEEIGDRYTVVFTGRYNNRGPGERNTSHWYIGMSAHPFHPQGICQLGENEHYPVDVDEKHHRWPPAYGKTGHLGIRIYWHQLPEDCQKAALHAYKELWDLYPAEAENGRIKNPSPSIRS